MDYCGYGDVDDCGDCDWYFDGYGDYDECVVGVGGDCVEGFDVYDCGG